VAYVITNGLNKILYCDVKHCIYLFFFLFALNNSRVTNLVGSTCYGGNKLFANC